MPKMRLLRRHPEIPSACLALLMAICLSSARQVAAQEAEPVGGQQLSGEQPIADSTYGRNIFRPLHIGDPIPEALWNLPLEVVNHPQGKETITLADYKGKLIILDFWATWCGPCIASLPKGDSIQRRFGDSVQVLLVNSIKGTGDKKEKINFILDNRTNPAGQRYVMPSVVNDTALKQAFPHKSIPHYVWVSDMGKVLATTGSVELQAKNIDALLNGQPHTFSNKGTTRQRIDIFNTIIDPRDDMDRPPKALKGKISGKMPLYNTGSGMAAKGNGYDKVYFVNFPLVQLLKRSFGIDYIPNNRIFVGGIQLTKTRGKDLISDSLFCYELILEEPVSRDSILAIAREDIERFSGYTAKWVSKAGDAYVLLLNDPAKVRKGTEGIADNNILDIGDGNKYVKNQKIAILSNLLNGICPIPLMDETGYDHPVDLSLPPDLTDIHALNEALLQQGFEIREERREWEVLEINKTNR